MGHRWALGILVMIVGANIPSPAAADNRVALRGHVLTQLQNATITGHASPSEIVQLSLVVRLDQNLLDDTYNQIYGRNASTNKHFLSSAEFAQKFNLADERNRLKAFAQTNGLTVETEEDRDESMIVKVSGPANIVENAFNVRLNHYQAKDGRLFRANDVDPMIPESLAPHLGAILGLSNVTGIAHPHLMPVPRPVQTATPSQGTLRGLQPSSFSGSLGSYLAPSDIQAVYGLSQMTLNGSGQAVALLELDGFNPTDIADFENAFGLPLVTPTFIGIDGTQNLCGADQNQSCNSTTLTTDFGGMGEVALDIEMVIALAPGISNIYVYDDLNSDLGIVAIYNQMATDNISKVISTSWGLDEADSNTDPAFIPAESQIFQRMAIQGQSIFAAAGDCGAYDTRNFKTGVCITNEGYHVDDPASQPYVTGVGGTTLTGSVASFTETTWNELALSDGGASGGGVSAIWPIPSYQIGVVGAASQQFRNVPDVSLNADWDSSPYVMWVGGREYTNGGTSAAAPLWAALTALINQERTATGKEPLGFVNPALYQIGTSTNAATAFKDITSGNNALYNAGSGYDNATGWGSFRGVGMISIASDAPSFYFSSVLSNVYASPNPWDKRKTTKSQVTIANLPDGATVKIYTLSGFWVKTLPTASAGGTAWDLTNDNGKSVASGLYFYLVSTPTDKFRGTIAIIK